MIRLSWLRVMVEWLTRNQQHRRRRTHTAVSSRAKDGLVEIQQVIPVPRRIERLENRLLLSVGDLLAPGVSLPVGNSPRDVTAGDFNRDGILDLAMADYGNGQVRVLLGTGGGSFRTAVAYAPGGIPMSLVSEDFNRDGILDLAVATMSQTLGILLGKGDGTFQPVVTYAAGAQSYRVVAGDLNGDGALDLVTADYRSSTLGVYFGKGDGSFQARQALYGGAGPMGVVIADLNGDGRLDLATANYDGHTLGVLLGNGNGTFQGVVQYPLGPHAQYVTAGDLNRDGVVDLAVANYGNIGVFLGKGDGTYWPVVQNPVGTLPAAVRITDLNLDGLADLVTANYTSNTVGVLLGRGNGEFETVVSFATNADPRAVLPVDWDGNGTPDVVVGSVGSGYATLLKNLAPPYNPHLAISMPSTVNLSQAMVGTTFEVTITALDDKNAIATGFRGRVHFASSDEFAELPSDYTFTDLDEGEQTFTVTLHTGGPQTVSATLVGSHPNIVAGATVDVKLTPLSLAPGVSLPVGNSPRDVTAGDFNRDGILDLAMADYGNGQVRVLLGTGGGSFRTAVAYAPGGIPMSLVSEDFNRDGILDLAVATMSQTLGILLGKGDGTFQPVVTYAAGADSYRVVAGDLNGDGVLDLVTADYRSSTLGVYFGKGDGSFQARQALYGGAGPMGVVIADLNGDGRLDLATANYDGHTLGVLLGNGNGTFQGVVQYPLGPHAQYVTAGDLNRDGVVDLAVANYGNIGVFLGKGDGTYWPVVQNPVGTLPAAVRITDLNLDGLADLVTANYTSNTVGVLLGRGNGEFETVVSFATNADPRAVLPVDWDGNGTPDVVVGSVGSGYATLLKNLAPPYNPHLAISMPSTVNLSQAMVGTTFEVTITALDDKNAIATGFRGRVHFASSDEFAELPSDYTFTDLDEGEQTFTVTLHTGGPQTVSATLVGSYPNIVAGATVDVKLTPLSLAPGVSLPVGNSPRDVTAGDFNRDGILDLAMADYGNGQVRVLLGTGGGSFRTAVAYAPGGIPMSLVSEDFNRDGILDLAVATMSQTLGILLGKGDGTFQPVVTYAAGAQSYRVVAGDLNGDGALDLVTADYRSSTLGVYFGKGDGSFQARQALYGGAGPMGVVIADLNGDGRLDLATANYDGHTLGVLLGNGNGTFQGVVQYPLGPHAQYVTAGDLNRDGVVDLAVANYGNIGVFLGKGDGTYWPVVQNPVGTLPAAVRITDLNLDGLPDLVASNQGSNNVGVLLGRGNGEFEPVVLFATNADPRAVLPVDWDGNGTPDVVVGSVGSGYATLLKNLAVPQDNYPPYGLSLSNRTILENELAQTKVGVFSTTDLDQGDTFTYSLRPGRGDADNARFRISGNTLSTNESPDYESRKSYSIRVRTTDQGGLYFDMIFRISVVDRLEVEAGANRNVIEGDLVTLASATYNGPLLPSQHRLTVNWGDGSSEPGVLVPASGTNGGTISNTHRYVDNGSYKVTLTLTDGSTTVSDSFVVTVANALPALGPIAGPTAAVRGQLVNFSMPFSDAGIADTQTALINWGDGTSSPGTLTQSPGTGTVSGSHVYSALGNYTITLIVTDDDGGSASQTKRVSIVAANLQPNELDPTKTDLYVGGTKGDDIITLAQVGSNATVTINSVNVGSYAPTGRILVLGLAGNDRLTIQSSVILAACLSGDDGNDTLTGGGGDDTLTGGAGNDVYQFDVDDNLGADTIDETGGGLDTLDFTPTTGVGVTVDLSLATQQTVSPGRLTLVLGSGTAFENVVGGANNDGLTGNTLANLLTGGAGDDTLTGGTGNDTFRFDADTNLGTDTLVESGTGGTDLIDFTGTSAGVTLDLSLATAQVVNASLSLILQNANGIENATGGDGDDTLLGNALVNSLLGGLGNDSLNGAAGNDSLTGGLGDDTLAGGIGNDIFVYAANTSLGSDTLVELAGEGIDLITFATTTTKAVAINLGLTTIQTVVAGTLNLTLNAADTFENVTGGSLADTLAGNSLANTLVGGPGNDTLYGGAGNDVYSYITSAALGTDTLVELAGEGADTLDFSLTTTLAVAVNLGLATTQVVNANLSLLLNAVDTFENASGGSLNDTLTGNALANSLAGNSGLDTLIGGTGSDTLDGGLGNDSLQGGADNDTYLLDADLVLGTETITELAGGGTDTLDFSLTTTKTVAVNLGLTTAQTVTASNLMLTLNAVDTFENVIGGTLNDTLTGNALSNRIDGNAGNDTLQGLAGDDTLIGGLGNDNFVFNTGSALGTDTLDESAGGLDTLDFSTTTTNSVTINLGETTIQVVNANLSLILGADNTFENATGGSLGDVLIGNALANTLTGNAGNDTLTGGAGNDTQVGGLGDDTYVFAANSALGTDTLNEAAGGTDTLDFSGTLLTAVTLNLGTTGSQVVNVNLSLILGLASAFETAIGGGGNDALTGNSLANVLSGGAGNDTLIGLAGNDTLQGGVGDDSYPFTATTALGTDLLVEAAGEGLDLLDFGATTVAVAVNLGLATTQVVNANLSLTLSAGDAFEMLIGSSGNDTLTGNSLANVLFGGAGNDTILGLAGRDLLFGGNGLDNLNGGDDEDIVVGGLTTYYSESTKVLSRTAIKAIWDEWTRTDLAYANRITNLKNGGGLNGTSKLSTLTVLTDNSTMFDTLAGGLGLDWFWQFAGDSISDLNNEGTETVN